jgi:hypothetical protein
LPDDLGDPIRSSVRAVRDELESLRRQNELLAAALGACERCWGSQSECPRCGGDGSPGSRRPDERVFEELVRPAIRRLDQLG